MKKIIKKLKSYLPMSRKSYVITMGHMIKLLDANDENHKLIRNDVYQLAVSIRKLREDTFSANEVTETLGKEIEGGMYN